MTSSFDPFELAPFCLWLPFAILALVIWLMKRHENKRAAAFKAWGAANGFAYQRNDPSLARLSANAPFGRGKQRRGAHVLRGEHRGESILMGEYRFVTGDDNKETHNYQVVAVPLPKPVPLLDIAHEGGFSRRFGADIDFENQAFNDKFRITSPDRRFAYDVVHARTMEWMLADPRAGTWQWRFEGPWLMTFTKQKLDPADALGRADFLLQVRAGMPAYLWSKQ